MWHAVIERMGSTPEAEEAFVEIMLAVWKRVGPRADVSRLRDQVRNALAALGISLAQEPESAAVAAEAESSETEEGALEETGLPDEVLPDLPRGLRNLALQRLRAQIAYEEAEVRRTGSTMPRVAAAALSVVGFALVGYGAWGERSSPPGQPTNAHHASAAPIVGEGLPVAVQAVFDITGQPFDLAHLAFASGEIVTGSLSLGPQGDGIELSAYAFHGLGLMGHPRWTADVTLVPPNAQGGSSWLLRSWSLASTGGWAVVTVNWTESGLRSVASETDVYAVPMAGGHASLLTKISLMDGGEIVTAAGSGAFAWQTAPDAGGAAAASPVHLAPIVTQAGAAALGPSETVQVDGLLINPHLTAAGLVCQGTTLHPAPSGAWVCIAPTGQETVYEGIAGAADGSVVEGDHGVIYAVTSESAPSGQTLEMRALHAAGSDEPAFRLDAPVSAWSADGSYIAYVQNSGGRMYLVVARAD